MRPLYEEISFVDPSLCLSLFEEQEGTLLFDCPTLKKNLSRYAYLCFDPFLIFSVKNNHATLTSSQTKETFLCDDPLKKLRELLSDYKLEKISDLPLFQTGVAGFLSYELFQYYEDILKSPKDDMNLPDLTLGFYDQIISFDCLSKKAWIVASGLRDKNNSEELAQTQLKTIKKILSQKIREPQKIINPTLLSLKSNFSTPEKYQTNIQKTIDYIFAGDIFQTNITQRFSGKIENDVNAFDLYHRLRRINPAPFASFQNWGQIKILSASPERFLKCENRIVDARPIKGTQKRSSQKNEDERLAKELLSSTKDRAENIMIVDLMRNDLSKVCSKERVETTEILTLESYETVHHLVSNVRGVLDDEFDTIDLLKATFPGGSITGAPKIRAQEIISEMEPHHRGIYCGSLIVFSFNGDMDTSITIRTLVIKDNQISFHVGGGIVADSDPKKEYEETLIKGFALKKCLLEVDS